MTHFDALRPEKVRLEANKGERRGGAAPEAVRLSHGADGKVCTSLPLLSETVLDCMKLYKTV